MKKKKPLDDLTHKSNIIAALGFYIWQKQRDLARYHSEIKKAKDDYKAILQKAIDMSVEDISSCKQTFEDLVGIPYKGEYPL